MCHLNMRTSSCAQETRQMQSTSGRSLLDEGRSAFKNSRAELNAGRPVVTGAQTHNLAASSNRHYSYQRRKTLFS